MMTPFASTYPSCRSIAAPCTLAVSPTRTIVSMSRNIEPPRSEMRLQVDSDRARRNEHARIKHRAVTVGGTFLDAQDAIGVGEVVAVQGRLVSFTSKSDRSIQRAVSRTYIVVG